MLHMLRGNFWRKGVPPICTGRLPNNSDFRYRMTD
jgi:hypothetical protein